MSDSIDKISLKYNDEYKQIIATINYYTEKKIEMEKDIDEINKLKIKLNNNNIK